MAEATERAYRSLKQDIDHGVYGPGSRLPGERDLAGRLGVSRVTARRALGRLATEGRLESSAQRGWFVPEQVLGEPPSTLQSFTEMVRARGLRPTTTVLRQEVRPATFDEADELRIAPAAAVIQIDRLRGMEGPPVCYDVVVLVHERAPALARADLTDRSLYEELSRLCDVWIHRSAYWVQADAADDATARLLQVPVGAPILLSHEVAYTEDGVPVLVGTNRYRGDAYRFEADLFRPRAGL
ncbi:MAG TPA: GntR family transcriptional regulator [Cellulomonas sp.]